MPKKQKPASQEFVLVERPYKKIAITFLVLAGLLVCVIGYFSLSRAIITLVPKDAEQTKTFTAQIILNATSTAELTGVYTEKTLSIAKTFDVKNFKTSEGRARGFVTITNQSAKNQTLIATTRFLSPNNLLFRLKNSVVVPAGGEIKGEIEADEIGQKYEIAPTTFTIPGLSADLQKKIYGVSKETMAGGVRKIGTVTAEEIAAAQKTVLSSLDEEIAKEIGSDENKVILFQKEIRDEKVSAKDGDEVENFTVTVRVGVKAMTSDKEKLVAWAKDQYQRTLSNQEDLVGFNTKSMAYALDDIAPSLANVKVSIAAATLGALDAKTFDKQKLYGLDAKGVRFYFTGFENVKEAEVIFSPFWVRAVPSLADHIEIRIKQ